METKLKHPGLGEGGAAIGWRGRYRHAGPFQTLIMVEGGLGMSCRLTSSSLSSTLNSFTTAHSSSRTLSQGGFKCSAALFLRCLFPKKNNSSIFFTENNPFKLFFRCCSQNKILHIRQKRFILIFQGKIRVTQSLTVSSCDLQACVNEQTVL